MPSRAALGFIFVTATLDMLALGLMGPIFPRLVVGLEGGDVGTAASLLGAFGAVWALMQFVFSPVLGALSDRFGRRPVVLLSNLGLAIDYVVMALAPSVAWLFVGRVFSGITSSSFSTASAYVADVTPPEKRAGRFGLLNVAFGIGFIVGPVVGGVLGAIDVRAPFWAAATLSFANFCYGFFILPESLPPDRRAPFKPRAANPIGAYVLLRSHSGLLALGGAALFAYLAHDVLPSLFVIYSDYRYAWDARTVGFSLALVGASSILVQGFVVGRVVARIGERAALAAGLLVGAGGLAIFGLAPVGALFALGIPVWAFFGLTGPSLTSLMSRRVGSTEQGRLQGAITSIRAISSTAAPILFTQSFGAAIAAGLALGLPFFIGIALLLAALALASASRPVAVPVASPA